MGVFDNYKQYNDAKQNLDENGVDIVECKHKPCVFNYGGVCLFETCIFDHPYMPAMHCDLEKTCSLCGIKYSPIEYVKKGPTYIYMNKNTFCPDCMNKLRLLIDVVAPDEKDEYEGDEE